MDSIKVAKVPRVLIKAGKSWTGSGTVHLTPHHIICTSDSDGDKQDELWVPYPLLSLVTRQPQTLYGQCPITLQLKTFEIVTFEFPKQSDGIDVFDSIKQLTVTTSVNQLYAFFYQPNPPLPTANGWSIYSPRDEFGRMGVGTRSKSWRFTDINRDYSFCDTYPARLVVPTKISDSTLQYASKYRSRNRIPVLTYLHWGNFGSITRSSQPMVGVTQSRSIQDEKLVEAIFQTHHSPESRVASTPVFGATATNLIIDARPTVNAMANTAKGAGTENMDNYKEGKKVYLGIDNIHAMRESLGKVAEALREAEAMTSAMSTNLSADLSSLPVLDRSALRRSGWLRHLSALLEATVLITRNVHVNSSHVLIHCSDGWDRTAQAAALSQLCLDPYFRTIRGFQILIEKDWISFGHKFLDRCGHLSSDKFFVSPTEPAGGGGGSEAAQAFFASVQNRFSSNHHVKETSPVFHQFLEAVQNLIRQYPTRFEFNQSFLATLYRQVLSCQFGTFLYNCERERRFGEGAQVPADNTQSVWDFLNSPDEVAKSTNPDYDTSLDSPTSREQGADMGVLFPNPKDVRFWHELYGRTDEEMNGRPMASPLPPELVGPIEGSSDDPALPALALAPSENTPRSTDIRSPPSPQPPSELPGSPTGLSALALPQTPSRPVDIRSPPSPRPHSASTPTISRTASPSSIGGAAREASSPGRATGGFSPPGTSEFLRAASSPTRGNRQADFFGSNVRSMWGNISSKASTAFSVVQDAYGDLAKDFQNVNLSPNAKEETLRTAELRDRDSLAGWGNETQTSAPSQSSRASDPSATFTIGASQNPWASVKAGPGLVAVPFDNPWSTARLPAPRHAPLPELFTAGVEPDAMPSDPTVAHPPQRSASTMSSQSSAHTTTNEDLLGESSPRVLTPSKVLPTSQGTISYAKMDPLGVGQL